MYTIPLHSIKLGCLHHYQDALMYRHSVHSPSSLIAPMMFAHAKEDNNTKKNKNHVSQVYSKWPILLHGNPTVIPQSSAALGQLLLTAQIAKQIIHSE